MKNSANSSLERSFKSRHTLVPKDVQQCSVLSEPETSVEWTVQLDKKFRNCSIAQVYISMSFCDINGLAKKCYGKMLYRYHYSTYYTLDKM